MLFFEKNLQTEYIHTTPMSVERVELEDGRAVLELRYNGGLNAESFEESTDLLWNVARMAKSHEIDRPINGKVTTLDGTTILTFRVEPEWCRPENPLNLHEQIIEDPSLDAIYSRILETVKK